MKNQLISGADFAKSVKNAVYLVKNLWKEHTTLLVHAPQTVDKTDRALEIISQAASSTQKIVYVSTGGNLDPYADRIASIDGLAVFKPAYDSPDDTRDYADLVISSIEEIVAEIGVRTFAIDSVSRIAALSFGRNSSAAYIMKRLAALQLRLRLSLLIIANDTTRSADRAMLTLADTETTPVDSQPTPDIVGSRPAATAEKTINSENPDKSDTSAPVNLPDKPRKQLSRRERRILRRSKQLRQ